MNTGKLIRNIKVGMLKNAPHIMTYGGIVGMIGGTVLACMATTKLKDILTKHEMISNKIEREEKIKDEETKAKAKRNALVNTSIEIAKIYAPSVALISLSAGSIIGGHSIMTKRNIALGAAYASISTAYGAYRTAVINKYGKEEDDNLRLGLKDKKVKELVTDENGKEKKETKTVKEFSASPSEYVRIFSPDYTKAAENNMDFNDMTLRAIEKFFNERLKAVGYVFLNDVLTELGYEPTTYGQSVGWIYDDAKDNTIGDNYIDFGIREIYDGDMKVHLLEFNVDGPILERGVNKGLIEE